jgi:hypothetical protein
MTVTRKGLAAIGAALKAFDDRCAFLWWFADVEFDHYAHLPDDPAEHAEHYRKSCGFALDWAGQFEDARRTLVEAINAVIASARPSDNIDHNDRERHWSNLVVEFELFDTDMAARWKALEILIAHYEAHSPDEATKVIQHYYEQQMFALDFVRKLENERKGLEPERRLLEEAERRRFGADVTGDQSDGR